MSNFENRGLGLIKRSGTEKVTAFDSTQVFTINAAALPASLNLRSYFTAIKAQGDWNTCVAFSTCALVEYYLKRYNGVTIDLSESMAHHPTLGSEGAWLESAAEKMKARGICTEVLRQYPSSSEGYKFSETLTAGQMSDALTRLLKTVNRMTPSNYRSIIKQSLVDGNPVLAGLDVYGNFNAPVGGIVGPHDGTGYRGAHAVVIVGYDDSIAGGSWLIRNSWGTTWGDSGYAWYPFAEFEKVYHNEFVTISLESNPGAVFHEDFEDDSMTIPFSGDWVRTAKNALNGSYAYTNKDITHSQNAKTSFKVTVPSSTTNAYLSFFFKLSTEYLKDYFTVSVGGTGIRYLSGQDTVSQWYTYKLPIGTSEVTFEYSKDATGDAYDDAAYIDCVVVRGTGVTVSVGSGGGGAVPGNASVSITSSTSNSLTLSMSASGATSYNVYRSTSPSGTYSLVASGVTSPYTNTGLSSNTTYYYKVAGVNSFGTGPQSAYAYSTTNNSGGVTPTTIVEDFSDSSFDPRLNLSLGGWEYDSSVGYISVIVDSTASKSVTLNVDIPSGATSRTLKLDHKGMVFGGSGVYHTQVFVNGALKHTFTESGSQWRTQTINLGTGYQTIEIRASSTLSAWASAIDNIVVSWK
ncbi:C1 family peptidase [Brevibacillus fortis]|uniref:C1 family peptidase n=1 Tax=Brevibacillus fortis TaxID=2126352 RepID=UPI0038FCD15A